ncbi:MAG TPA: hypothetical protein VL595_11660 [Pseudonocardia sp.]|jgi:hypothetical protein|nr:hypothetical protein [Pseudonocardia sp.]
MNVIASSAGARHMPGDVALLPPSVVLLAASTPSVFLIVAAPAQDVLVISSTPLLFFVVVSAPAQYLLVVALTANVLVPATPISLAHSCRLLRTQSIETP